MANKVYSDVALRLDNAAGTLTAITNWVNTWSLAGAQQVIEEAGAGDTDINAHPGQHRKSNGQGTRSQQVGGDDEQ